VAASLGTKRWIAVGLLAAAGLCLLYAVRAVLPPFIFALAITYLLNPPVNWLCGRGLSRNLAIFVLYLVGGLTVAAFWFFALPPLIREITQLAEDLPRLAATAEEFTEEIWRRYREVPLPDGVREALNESLRRGENLLDQTLREAVDGVVFLLSQVLNLIVAPILAFYFLSDTGGLTRRVRAYVPRPYQEEVLEFLKEMDTVLQNFVAGRLLLAFLVGLLTAAGLAVIGMKFAFALGLIAGACDLIPYFGPLIGALPAVTLAAMEMESVRTVIYVVLLFLVVQQVENHLLSPLILGERVGLHPVVVIFALLAGGHLFGVWGLLVAVPAAAIIRLLLRHLFRHLTGR